MGDNKISEAVARLERAWVAGMDEEYRDDLRTILDHLQGEAVPVAWELMQTCPRDGTVVLLRFGEDHVSPGWWSAPASPIMRGDGTWPSESGGFPWAFFDINNGSAFVNHAVDTEYGPTHWAPYHPQPAELSEVSGDSGEVVELCGRTYLRSDVEAALAATGKQKAGEVLSVDLDNLRGLAMKWRAMYDNNAKWGECNKDSVRGWKACSDELLYIVDGRDAGTGVE